MANVPASERDAFYDARRTALTEAALRLWARDGFDHTSVARIAREAGIAKGTFYLYFESKDALLLEVLRRNSFLPNILALVEDLKSRPLDEAVHGFVRGAWRHLCDHRDLLLVVIQELPRHLPQARELVERVMVPSNALLARHLEQRIGSERAKQISTVLSVRALIGMVVMVFLTQEILEVGRFLPATEDEVTRTIAELFLHGVAPASGEGST